MEVQYSVGQRCDTTSGLSMSPRAAEPWCRLTWLLGVRNFYRKAPLIRWPLLAGNQEIQTNLSFWVHKNWIIKKNPSGINSWHERNKTGLQDYIFFNSQWVILNDWLCVCCMHECASSCACVLGVQWNCHQFRTHFSLEYLQKYEFCWNLLIIATLIKLAVRSVMLQYGRWLKNLNRVNHK